MVFAAKQIRTPIDENARKVTEQQQYEGEDKKRSDNYQRIAREMKTFENERILLLNKRKEALSAPELLKGLDSPITAFDDNLFLE